MVLKKILKNLLIFFGVLVAIFFVAMGCLYFIPNATIFGIKFKKPVKSPIKRDLLSYADDCESITLNLGHVNLDVQPASDDARETFTLQCRDDILGLIKANKEDLSKEKLTCDVTLEGKNLIITFNAPEGWLFWKDTWATLSINKAWLETLGGNANNGKKLIINTTDAKVDVATSLVGYVSNFDYVEFNSTGKGTFSIYDQVNNLKIHSNKGKSTVIGPCNYLEYTTTKGELDFNMVGKLDASAKNCYIHGKVVGGRFTYTGGDGKINIEQIGESGSEAETVINGGYVATNISKLFGKIKLDVNKGNVSIANYEATEFYPNEIKTNKAKIEVYNIKAQELSLISAKGEIKASASGDGNLLIANTSAKILFTGQDGDGGSFSGNLTATNKNGEISLNKISSEVTAETTGRGKINAEFTSTKGTSNLKTNKGKVNVKVNIAESLTIDAKSEKRKVIVDLAPIGISYTDKSHQVKTINVGGSNGTNKININTVKANITIGQV